MLVKIIMQQALRLGLLVFLLCAVSLPASAHPGIGIVMDRRGNVFYTDLEQVWKIAPDGGKSIVVRGVHTHELYLDAEGYLYGEHLWYEGDATGRWGHYLWRLPADGAVERLTPDLEGFRTQHSFVRDAGGNMYWFDAGPPAGFVRRAPDGSTTRLGESSSYRDVRWITATPDGALYFTDHGDLRRMSANGTVTTLASGLRERDTWSGLSYGIWLLLAAAIAFGVSRLRVRWLRALGYGIVLLAVSAVLVLASAHYRIWDRHDLMGIWLDGQGRVYVAVMGAGMVKRYDPATGRIEVVDRSPEPATPTGGLVAPNGDLWLLENAAGNAVRVRRIAVGGREQIF